MDAHVKLVKIQLTAGMIVNCSQAIPLLEGLNIIEVQLADKGYDTNAILEYTQEHEITAVILPKRSRKVQREYYRDIYKLCHMVENAFLYLKQWRDIATRYAKNAASFLAAIHIRCI